MGQEIKALDIKISADASRASKSIDNLCVKLSTLSRSLSSISGSGLSSFSGGVNQLSAAMQNMNLIKTADVTRLSKNLTSISQLNTSGITSTANSMRDLATSLTNLKTVQLSQTSLQISELAKGIAQLGYKSSTQAIQNIPQLALAMKTLMNTLASVPAINPSIIDMTNALARLARTGKSSGTSAKALGSALKGVGANANSGVSGTNRLRKVIDKLNPSLLRTRKNTFSLAAAFGKLYASYFLVFRGLHKVGEAVEVASSLAEVQNVIDVTFGDFKYKIEDLAQTSIEKLGMSELAVKKFAGRFQSMGTSLGITGEKMSDMSITLTKLTSDLSSFFDVEQDVAATALQSIFTGETKPLRRYGLDISNATIQQWALNEGMSVNVKTMNYMEKAMLRYQYVLANTQHVQGDFIRTQDTWANQVRILKNNFQALGVTVGGIIINFFKPFVKALNQVMVQVNKFATMISEALGTIFGWKFESNGGITDDLEDGSDAAEDIGDNLDQATKNAKKLKQQLQGFDELNVISENKDSSSGGDGTLDSLTDSYGKWEKTNDGIVDSFKSSIKDLYTLGATISETLADAMDRIDWETIYEKAADFGKNLADYMNGRFASAEGKHYFDALGTTIASAIKTSLIALDSFALNFDWTAFGSNLASGINSFFKTFKFADLAKTIADTLNGIVSSAYGFATTFDWSGLGHNLAAGINTFFSTFDFEKLGETIHKTLSGIFSSVTTLLKDTDFDAIGKRIGDLLVGLDWTSLLSQLGDALWRGIKGAFDLLKGLITEAPLESAIIASIGYFAFAGVGSNIASKIAQSIATSMAGEAAWGNVGSYISAGSAGISKFAGALSSAILAAVGGFEFGKMIGQIIAENIGDTAGAEAYKNFSWKDFFGAFNAEDAKGAWNEFWKEVTGEGSDTHSGSGGTTHGGGGGTFTVNVETTIDKYTMQKTKDDLYSGLGVDANKTFSVNMSPTINPTELANIKSKFKSEFGTDADNAINLAIKLGIPGDSVLQGIKDNLITKTSPLVTVSVDKVPYFPTEVQQAIKDAIQKDLPKAETQVTLSSVPNMPTSVQDAIKNAIANGTRTSSTVTPVLPANHNYSAMKSTISSNTNTNSTVTPVVNNTALANVKNGITAGSASVANVTPQIPPNFNYTKKITNVIKKNAKTAVSCPPTAASEDIKKYKSRVQEKGKADVKFGTTLDTTRDKIQSDIDKNSYSAKVGNLDTTGIKDVTINTNLRPSYTRNPGMPSDVWEIYKKMFPGYPFQNALGGIFKNGSWKRVQQYALGGMPNRGQAFIARERGPELVGTIGSSTAVVNNNQIVSSVSAGVYKAVAEAMSGNANQPIQVYLDGKVVFDNTRQRANDYYRRTGNSAFAY